MAEHKMVVIDDVRYRLEDAKERGLVDEAGKPVRKARASRASRRVTGDETLAGGSGGTGSGDGAGAGTGGDGAGAGTGGDGTGGDGAGAGTGGDGGNGGQGDGSN